MTLVGTFHALVAILGCGAVVNVGGQVLLLSRVRWGHPVVWRSLGEPRFFMWTYGPLAKRYRAYVSSQDLDALDDSVLLVARQVVNVSGWVVVILFLACVGLRWFGRVG